MTDRKADAANRGRTDWAALRAMPDAEIERIAAEDEDNPATDADHWAEATVGLPADHQSNSPRQGKKANG